MTQTNRSYGAIPTIRHPSAATSSPTEEDTVFDLSYTRDSRSAWRPWVAAGGAILLVTAAVLVSLGPSSSESSAGWRSSRLFTPRLTTSRSRSHSHHRDEDLALTTLHKHNRTGPSLRLMDTATDHTELWYHEQLVDHFANHNITDDHPLTSSPYWSHRYYKASKYFRGPGSPIFVIVAGEGPVDDIMYPFIEDGLAKTYGGFVLETEHRFYGDSQVNNGPVGSATKELTIRYLAPEQALSDYIRLIRFVQDDLGCSRDRSSPLYCPVVCAGASYPGFLATMMRFVHHDVVDIGYGSSAVLKLYAQETGPYEYYDWISDVADRTVPGCAAGVRNTVDAFVEQYLNAEHSVTEIAKDLDICVESIPTYALTMDRFRNILTWMVATTFADFDMGNYPPYPYSETEFYLACKNFTDPDLTVLEKMNKLFVMKNYNPDSDCFDMRDEIPSKGPDAPPHHEVDIIGSDWSGAGSGNTGRMWDFQTCRDLVVKAGMSPQSMFVPREWTLSQMTDHCLAEWGVTPEPFRMLAMWNFWPFVENGASYIVFTNGMNDGWAPASITYNMSDNVVAFNMVNGAHHSDLWPGEGTPDVEENHRQVSETIGLWLNELYGVNPVE